MFLLTRTQRLAVVLAGLLLFNATGAFASGAIPLSSVTSMTTARAAADRERLWADGCMGYESTTVPRHCVYGVPTSATIVALVGDSHASHLFPAVEKLAKQQGWRLEVFVKVSCAFIDMKVWNAALRRTYRECATWNANVVRRIAALKPAMTLVVNSRLALVPANLADRTNARKGAAIGREIAKLYGRVTLIVDSPRATSSVPACLAAHLRDIRPCASTRTSALRGSLGLLETIAAAATGDSLINLTSAICPAWSCLPVRNRAIIYRDTDHLTATFARSLSSALAAQLLPLMRSAARAPVLLRPQP